MFLGNVLKMRSLNDKMESGDYEDQRGSLKLKVCMEQLNSNFQTLVHKMEENTRAYFSQIDIGIAQDFRPTKNPSQPNPTHPTCSTTRARCYIHLR